jgi:hypothetical protein
MYRRPLLIAALAVGVASSATACSGAAPVAGTRAGLSSDHFQIIHVIRVGQVERPVRPFDLFFARRTATAVGCNTLAFHWTLRRGQLLTSNWMSTLVGCPESMAISDDQIARFLQARPTVVVHGQGVVLRTPHLEWRGRLLP